MFTIANPESRADVLLDALSLARLRCNRFQDSAWLLFSGFDMSLR